MTVFRKRGQDGRVDRARCAAEGLMVSQEFRLRPIMKQGTASSIEAAWTHYPTLEAARAAAKLVYHDDRVLRVMIVRDSAGSFVEWFER
jgi:hypothetical protein